MKPNKYKNTQPVNTNNIVDPNINNFNPSDPNYVPNTKQELEIAIKLLMCNIDTSKVPYIYNDIKRIFTDKDMKNIKETKKQLKELDTSNAENSSEYNFSFDEIAKELKIPVSSAKKAVQDALKKAKFVATNIDSEELEIATLNALSEYINMLATSGELNNSEVELLHKNPSIVKELDGFREFLDGALKKIM